MEYTEYINKFNAERENLSNMIHRIEKADFLRRSANDNAPYLGAYQESDDMIQSIKNYLEHDGMTVFILDGARITYDIETVSVHYPDDPEVDEWNGQTEDTEMKHYRLASVKELREITGYSQRKFGDMYGIPYRTIQNWEGGVNDIPEYLLILMSREIKRK